MLIYRRIVRVDIADQGKDILAGVQTKGTFHTFLRLPAQWFILTLLIPITPVASLDKLHAKHALPGFSDRSAEEREIEAATTDITKVIDGYRFSWYRIQLTSHRLHPRSGLPTMPGVDPANRNDSVAHIPTFQAWGGASP